MEMVSNGVRAVVSFYELINFDVLAVMLLSDLVLKIRLIDN